MEPMIYAGFWRRALANLIDGIICLLILFPLSVVESVIILGIFFIAHRFGVDKHTISLIIRILGYCSGWVIPWLYFALMEASPWQATFGKKLYGMKVTDIKGNRLSFARASGRNLAKWISNYTCFVGYIMAAFTPRRQSLHDMIAKTLVLEA